MFGAGYTPIAEYVLRALTFLIAMAVHEFAHAYAANAMGDSTARDMGRMTLNPFVNINWFGFLMAILIGFGFLGSAPVNESRMRNRRVGMLVAVGAGPISNLILAALCAIPFWFGMQVAVPGARDYFPTIAMFFYRMVWLNLILFLFNLIPLFPLDGWTIMLKLVPPDLAYTLGRYTRESMYIFYGLIILSFLGFDILGTYLLYPPLGFFIRLLIPAKAYLGF